MKRKIINSLILIVLILSFSTVALANYIPSISPSLNGHGGSNVERITLDVIGTLMWIGYAIAVGMIVFIGIKYIMASADERASMKGALVKVIIGAVIIASAVSITDIVLSLAS